MIKDTKAKKKEHRQEREEEETIKNLPVGSEDSGFVSARGRRGRRWPATNGRSDETAAPGFVGLLVAFLSERGGAWRRGAAAGASLVSAKPPAHTESADLSL